MKKRIRESEVSREYERFEEGECESMLWYHVKICRIISKIKSKA